jgi:hypothetical protein
MSFHQRISRKRIKPKGAQEEMEQRKLPMLSDPRPADLHQFPTDVTPTMMKHASLLQLQHHAGNHHVSRMLAGTRLFLQPADERRINYTKATKENQKLAVSLGWGTKLAEVKPEWAELWSSGRFDDFADSVFEFQSQQGFRKSDVDGILGRATWNRMRPIGEVIASQGVAWEKSKSVCSIATDERLRKGYERATGKKLFARAEKNAYRIILHSIESEYDGVVEDEYRGTGAAGALVYLGVGEFVDASEIWDHKGLKPGAAMQVWRKQSDLDRQKNGEAPESIGTSFVFVRYVGDDAMEVLHFNRLETINRNHFEFWVGANLLSR